MRYLLFFVVLIEEVWLFLIPLMEQAFFSFKEFRACAAHAQALLGMA